MRQTQAIIQRVERLNPQYQHVDLGLDESFGPLLPGQSLLVRRGQGWQPYLRQQWWPVRITPNLLVIERPGDVRYEPGEIVDVLGPVGTYFRFRRNLRHVLMLAYDTPPTPLLAMIPMLIAAGTSLSLVLLGEARAYKTAHLPPQVEVLRGNADLDWDDKVMAVGLADQVFVVVRPDDELRRFHAVWQMFSELRAEVRKNYMFGVFQAVTPCGAGACHACMIRLNEGAALTCVDGPALDLLRVKLT
jgi:ferredoxin